MISGAGQSWCSVLVVQFTILHEQSHIHPIRNFQLYQRDVHLSSVAWERVSRVYLLTFMDCLIGAAGTYCIGVLLSFTRIVMSVLQAPISLVVKPVMNMAAKAYDMHWCWGHKSRNWC